MHEYVPGKASTQLQGMARLDAAHFPEIVRSFITNVLADSSLGFAFARVAMPWTYAKDEGRTVRFESFVKDVQVPVQGMLHLQLFGVRCAARHCRWAYLT